MIYRFSILPLFRPSLAANPPFFNHCCLPIFYGPLSFQALVSCLRHIISPLLCPPPAEPLFNIFLTDPCSASSSLCLSVCLSVCLFVCLSVCLSVCHTFPMMSLVIKLADVTRHQASDNIAGLYTHHTAVLYKCTLQFQLHSLTMSLPSDCSG